MQNKFPNRMFSGFRRGGHVQGIAIDEENGFIYFSFTTALIKTDFEGNIKGSVRGVAGHLGCITIDTEIRKIYASLEYKHDAIGKGIINYTGEKIADEDAFYIACFDMDKITHENMDAEKDGIMRAVYLPDVVKDYLDTDEVSSKSHRYGTSGIDGIALGPEFGNKSNDKKIMLAYGIYSDTERQDNDHQIILQFGRDVFEKYGKPLNQAKPHHSGTVCEKRYFFFTGNTEYGIQNFEYDKFTNTYIASVYHGFKDEFVNYPMFFIDANKEASEKLLLGRKGEKGLVIFPAQPHTSVKDTRGGCDFKYGQTGFFSFGDGRYAISHGEISGNEKGEFSAEIVLYKFSKNDKSIFEEVKE